MTCRELIEFLDEYEAGTQPPQVRAEFERHLRVCLECRDYLKTYRDTLALARRAACEEHGDRLPDDVPEDLIEAVLAARRAGGAGRAGH
jgi:predicted anti-sigma-YlaC factor YlaD